MEIRQSKTSQKFSSKFKNAHAVCRAAGRLARQYNSFSTEARRAVITATQTARYKPCQRNKKAVCVFVNLWHIKFHSDKRNKFRYHGLSA